MLWYRNENLGKILKILHLKKFTLKVITSLRYLGFDVWGSVEKVRSLKYFSRYRKELREFQKLGGRVDRNFMILADYSDQSGEATGHYFHQDLLVAQMIFHDNPNRHIDVGSSIGGFVAHVASFREIEVLDVRPLIETGHSNIIFHQADLMKENALEITDSLSCLHVIEHFGLGRYGDSIDPKGYIKGFNNLIDMLKPGGVLYISFPIGENNKVYFNAHRVFHPLDILSWSDKPITLTRFDYVDIDGKLQTIVDVENEKLNILEYGCGIYTFRKSDTPDF